MTIFATTCQASNATAGFSAIVNWVAQQAGIALSLREDIDWVERYALLDRSEIDLAWICGAPYVRRTNLELELLAAPVMLGERYDNRPIYFSNILVRHDHPAQTFADLRGTTFAINEPNSQSGALSVTYHLAKMGLGWDFFGRIIQSGAHLNSLQLIEQGVVVAAAIDSTVFDIEVAKNPVLANRFRMIDAIDPIPIPPYVIGRWVDADVRVALREGLVGMADSTDGRAILHAHGYRRFHPVTDADYDFIRETHRV